MIPAALPLLFALSIVQPSPAPRDDRVTIPSDGGWVLVGNLHRPTGVASAPAVLLLHGAARDRRAYLPLARELASRGIASLRLDLRGEGESTNLGRFEPGLTPLFPGTEKDIAAALAWLSRQPGIDAARIGALGASYTGDALARAARSGSQATAYVALSPGDFSEESMRAIDPAGRPWWFIASKQERFAHRVVSAIPAVSRTARVTLVDGTSHGSDILSPHDVLNAEIADWFAGRLHDVTAPAAWGSLRPGASHVGFTRHQIDSGSRQLVVDVWYPTASSTAPAMELADYLRLADDLRGAAAGSSTDGDALRATASIAVAGDAAALTAEQITRVLRTGMGARRDAPPAAGKYPLMLWTPRYATTVAQATASEYLASLGFVVAFARPAAPVKLPFELPSPEARAAELRERVGDMQRALEWLDRQPHVDAARIAVCGWSYTGEMATAFALAEPRVALVAGLSTTLLNDWVFQPGEAIDRFDTSRLQAAVAVMTESREGRTPPPKLASLATAYFIEFPGLAHGSFNALEGHLPSLLGIDRVQKWSRSSPAGARGYEAAAVMLSRLLRHHLVARSTQPLAPLALTSGLADGVAIVR